jgi:VanZ family protein
MAAIFYISSLSDPVPDVRAIVWDKLLHLVEYAGLAVLFARALHGEGMTARRASWVAILLASAYGASDELHQLSVPLREAELEDWIVDTIGAGIGVLAYGQNRARDRFSKV